jgi:hypothetical protein
LKKLPECSGDTAFFIPYCPTGLIIIPDCNDKNGNCQCFKKYDKLTVWKKGSSWL